MRTRPLPGSAETASKPLCPSSTVTRPVSGSSNGPRFGWVWAVLRWRTAIPRGPRHQAVVSSPYAVRGSAKRWSASGSTRSPSLRKMQTKALNGG